MLCMFATMVVAISVIVSIMYSKLYVYFNGILGIPKLNLTKLYRLLSIILIMLYIINPKWIFVNLYLIDAVSKHMFNYGHVISLFMYFIC